MKILDFRKPILKKNLGNDINIRKPVEKTQLTHFIFKIFIKKLSAKRTISRRLSASYGQVDIDKNSSF